MATTLDSQRQKNDRWSALRAHQYTTLTNPTNIAQGNVGIKTKTTSRFTTPAKDGRGREGDRTKGSGVVYTVCFLLTREPQHWTAE